MLVGGRAAYVLPPAPPPPKMESPGLESGHPCVSSLSPSGSFQVGSLSLFLPQSGIETFHVEVAGTEPLDLV